MFIIKLCLHNSIHCISYNIISNWSWSYVAYWITDVMGWVMNIVNHTHCTHSMVSCGCVETDILSKHVSLLANLFDLLMVLLLLSLIVNSLYGNVLVVVAMVKWNIFRIIVVTIITSFSHKIFEYVLHVKYHPLFSFSASLFSTIPYHSYDHLLSLIHFLTKSCCLEIPYESICWREFMLAISSKIYLWRFLFWRFPSSPRVGRCPS